MNNSIRRMNLINASSMIMLKSSKCIAKIEGSNLCEDEMCYSDYNEM